MRFDLRSFNSGATMIDQANAERRAEEEAAYTRQKRADEMALRKVLSGEADMAGSAQPRSTQIQAIQRVGTNLFSNQGAADKAAEMANFASGADEPGSTAPKTEPTAAYKVAGRGIFNDSADAAAAQAGVVAEAGAFPQRGRPDAADDFGAYLNKIAPRTTKMLISQGKFDQAKTLNDFLDSENGKTYTRAWGGAMRKVSMGDFDGAIPALERLYTSVPDGKRAKATSLGDGKYRLEMFNEADGSLVGTRDMTADDLSRQAIMALDPAKIAETFVKQQGERGKEEALLDRQLRLEEMRQTGRETSEDRRDERLGMRLDAQGRQLERRIAADTERRAGGKPLTAAQQRSNAEIDAAHKTLAGLTGEEIRDRSTTTMQNGRENKLFDPAIASAAKLARRRKIGDDPDFDARSGGKQNENAAASTRADVAQRFRADKTMNNRTLGKETSSGIEVIEQGRVIGHYR